MISFQQLRDLEPDVFTAAGRRWQDLASRIADRANDLSRYTRGLEQWSGAAAEAAKAELAGYHRKLTSSADRLARIPPCFVDATSRLGEKHRQLLRVVKEAEALGLYVEADGSVSVMETDGGGTGRQVEQAQLLTPVLQDLVRQANEIDGEIANRLHGLTAEAVGLAPPAGAATATASVQLPGRGASPAEVARWWDSLSPMQQESLLFARTGEIGMLDGIPAGVRDRANRARLEEQKAELQTEKQWLEGLGDERSDAQDDWLKQVNNNLGSGGLTPSGLTAIEQRLDSAGPGRQQAYLLGLDTAGQGRAIVAMGNPDTAANVATSVPGTGTNLGNAQDQLDRSDRMVQAAKEADSPSTSVVTWMGYDAPPGITDAASPSYAEDAAGRLDRFQDGLRATHEGPPSHNTVLGHSYGSTVIGHAAAESPLAADELVFAGSPGVGVQHASDLNIPPEHVHATVAENDIIQATNLEYGGGRGDPGVDPIHGPDPASREFGGHVFTSDPGTAGSLGGWSEVAHSEYWTRDSKSLENFGRIIAGQPTI